jgi:hypothetical protein
MSQRFNFMDFLPEGKEIMVDIPRNKYANATLQQLHYDYHPRVHMDKSKCQFEWLCDTLIQTYNTSILDVSDTTFKDTCIEEAYKCVREDRDSERKVLSQLILNHSKQNDPDVPKEEKKPITDFIGGPLSLTMHWSKQYKKLIYIFGERHSRTDDCWFSFKSAQMMLIEDYLEQLFKHTDVFIDFYLETPITYPDSYGDQRIGVMAKRFKDCVYNPNTKENQNKCKLSRMHCFDIRKETPELKSNRMSYATLAMVNIANIVNNDKSLLSLRNLLDKYNYDTQIKPILEEFSKINIYDDKGDDEKYAEYDAFWDKQTEEHIFVTKKVNRSTIHDKIKSFIKKEIRNLDHKYYKQIDIRILLETVKDFIATLDKYRTETVNKYDFKSITDTDRKILLDLDFSGFLIIINSKIVDYYLLCRIFKVFDFTKLTNRRLTDEPKEPHNIIIYAGDLHSENVRKFLKELEFKEISTTSSFSNVSNCIDIRKFPQPFFSNHKKVKWSDKLEEEEYNLLSEVGVDELELAELQRQIDHNQSWRWKAPPKPQEDKVIVLEREDSSDDDLYN